MDYRVEIIKKLYLIRILCHQGFERFLPVRGQTFPTQGTLADCAFLSILTAICLPRDGIVQIFFRRYTITLTPLTPVCACITTATMRSPAFTHLKTVVRVNFDSTIPPQMGHTATARETVPFVGSKPSWHRFVSVPDNLEKSPSPLVNRMEKGRPSFLAYSLVLIR